MARGLIVAITTIFCASAFAQLQTITLQPGVDGYDGVDDTSLYQDHPDNAGGAVDGLFVGTTFGRTGQVGGDESLPAGRRALLRFDLSDLPEGFVVTAATVELDVIISAPGGPPTMETTLHRVTANWGEGTASGLRNGGFGSPASAGDATWNNAFHDQVAWTNPGGDFDPTISATSTVMTSGSTAQWSSAELAADVQFWIDNPMANFGWIFIGQGEGVDEGRVRKFGSSEESGREPRLIIQGGVPQTVMIEQGLNGYMGFEDTSIFEAFPNNSGGASDGIFSGTVRDPIVDSRALLRADLSMFPDDSVVIAAALTMRVNSSGGFFGDISYGLHSLNTAWGEGNVDGADNPDVTGSGAGAAAETGDATWLANFFNQSTWDTPGGDFNPSSSAAAVAGLPDSFVTWQSAGMVADVQAWIADPATNFGWILVSEIEGTSQRVKEFNSSEAGQNRPRLTLDIIPGNGPEDLDGSGAVDAVDIQLVINGALALPTPGVNPDVNGDNMIDAVDVQLVILRALGL